MMMTGFGCSMMSTLGNRIEGVWLFDDVDAQRSK